MAGVLESPSPFLESGPFASSLPDLFADVARFWASLLYWKEILQDVARLILQCLRMAMHVFLPSWELQLGDFPFQDFHTFRSQHFLPVILGALGVSNHAIDLENIAGLTTCHPVIFRSVHEVEVVFHPGLGLAWLRSPSYQQVVYTRESTFWVLPRLRLPMV